MNDALVLGVIGHVDHGKTTLVGALTGIETDRLEEERRRGISIALGFAHLRTAAGAVIDVIDMPGHERFVRTMISGATGIDAVLLVVAADGGVARQTVEHVEIAGLLGIGRAVVAVSRADLADADIASLVGEEAHALLAANGIETAAVVAVSAVTGAGVAALLAALEAEAARGRTHADDGFAFLPVDRTFTIAGAGTVATGTLRRGVVHEGDTLEAFRPGGDARALRVRSVQVRGARAASAGPGRRTALNLRGVEVDELPRGTVLATPGILQPARWLTVRLAATADAMPNGMRLMLLAATDEVAVRLRLLDGDALEPGAGTYAQLHAARPVALPVRERFVLRVASPARTVGGGTVLDTADRRERRGQTAVLARLAARDGAPPQAVVLDALARVGADGTTLELIGRAAGIAPARAASVLAGTDALVTRRGEVIGRDGLARLARRLPALVTAGARPDGVADGLVDAAVSLLVGRGVLASDGNRLRVVDAARDAAAARDAVQAAARLAARLKREGLTPPDLPTLAPDAASRRLVEHLVRGGIAVRATDKVQKRDWVFHADAVVEARARLAVALAASREGLLVGEAGSVLGLTRRHSVPLLEHLDAVRFTRRVGDRRVLARE